MAEKKKRERYPQEIRDAVIERYPLCRTKEDKIELAKELNIETESRLYNLASRLGVAGSKEKTRTRAKRTAIKEDPKEADFTDKSDEYIRSEFGRRPIEDIAFHTHHSEAATLYRARHLGLRRPVKYWRLEKVAGWFDMNDTEIRELEKEGLEINPLTGLEGKIDVELVSTTSIARWLKDNAKKLRKRKNPDEFFILEIEETIEEIIEKKNHFELCKFLSHGHVCMNPRSYSSYGYYCTNNDRYLAGNDPLCNVKIYEIEDLKPDSDS